MDSFLPTEQIAILVFFNICLLLIMHVLMKGALKPPYIVSSTNRKTAIFLMVIFVLFSFWGADWFGYYKSYLTMVENGRTNLEEIYYWIVQNLSPNYLIFRIIVWGGSLALFIHLIKRLSIPIGVALFLFGSIYIIWFSYARATVSMILVYYGLSLFYIPYKNKLLSSLIGLSAIGCSFFFHKSALFAIAISILVILSNKNERKVMTTLLILYPILVIVTSFYLGDFVSMEMESIEGEVGSNFAAGQRYLEKEKGIRGPGILIQKFFEYIPYYLLTYISFKYIRSKYYKSCPDEIKAFIRLLFFIVITTSIFAFDLGVNTSVVYVRFLRFAAIPAVVVLSYFISTRFYPRLTKFTYQIAFIGTLYAMLYAMYNAYVGHGLF